jgi:hypothetical protein
MKGAVAFYLVRTPAGRLYRLDDSFTTARNFKIRQRTLADIRAQTKNFDYSKQIRCGGLSARLSFFDTGARAR